MKVIGLIPFKNEEHFLPTYLSNVKPICDEIIAVDDHSTDNSRKIMEDAGVIVKGYEDTEKLKGGWTCGLIRQHLFNYGREAGGTHFVCLDADRIEKTFKKKSISMIFLDTIHTYEQVAEEFKLWEPYMKDDCVMLIDDIRPSMPGRTKWRFHTELDYTHKYDVTEWAHNDTGYGVYLK